MEDEHGAVVEFVCVCEGGIEGGGGRGGQTVLSPQTERVSDSGAFNSEEQIVGCVCSASVGGHDDCAFSEASPEHQPGLSFLL